MDFLGFPDTPGALGALSQIKNEAALREAERGFRYLADFVPQLMWMAGPDGWIDWYNQRWYAYTGTTFAEMEGWGWQSVHAPDLLPEVLTRWKAAIAASEPFEMEFPLRGKDGLFRSFLTRVMPIKGDEGQVLRWIGTNTDISKQVQAENSLRESEERFQILEETAPSLIWIAGANAECYFFNQAWLNFTGRTLEQEIGNGWTENVYPEDLEACLASYLDAFRRQVPFELEYRLRRHDGEYRWILDHGKPQFNQQSDFVGYVGSCLDIHDRKLMEERLRETENRYQTVVDSNLIGIVISDLDRGLIIESNDSFLNMVGYSREDLLAGKISWNTMTPTAQKHLNEKAISEIRSQGVCAPFEKQYIHKNGSLVDAYVGGTRLKGHTDRSITFILDISEKKQAELAVQESEARFRAMADSAPLFIWLSGRDGKTSYINKTWTDFLGIPCEEAIGGGMEKAMDPGDQAAAAIIYRRAFAKREPYSLESRFRDANGNFRWLLNKGAPLFLPNGELAGYIGTGIDITDRKLAEEQQEQKLAHEQLIRQVMEIISQSFDIDLILQTVAETVGVYLGADRASVNHYSMHGDELVMNMAAQYVREGCRPVDPADVDLIANAVRHLNPTLVTQDEEHILNISDQTMYIEHLRARMAKFENQLPGLNTEKLIEIVLKYEVQSSLRVNIFYRGTPYGSISLSQCTHNREWLPVEVELVKTIADYAGIAIYQAELYKEAQHTALKEQQARTELEHYAKKLEISNRELEQFATIASHDLQEPLRKVQLFSGMLAETASEEDRVYIERVQNATSRMQTLISDLLNLSRITRQGQPFRKVQLAECVQDAVDQLEISVQETGARIVVNPLGAVEGDASQLTQLFQNLISNGLKFTQPDTPPVIEISGVRLSEQFYEVTIQDYGIGFDDKYANRIFEPFERLHGRFKFPGTGIGLAICRKIVDRHGGDVWAESKPGEGTRFIIRLPVTQRL